MVEDVRAALAPVLHWYQSDEHEDRATADIVHDVVEDLQVDRAQSIWAAKVYRRLAAARQTNSLNSGWHDLESEGRKLFSLEKEGD